MSISVADNFQYLGAKPLDARVKYDTVANMVAVASANLYDGCFAYVTATKKNYQYDSSNDTDPTLGKWRELPTGGGGGSKKEGIKYSTTEQVVGEWIDGRPLYQKTIDFGALPKNTSKSVAHNISSISTVCNIYGIGVGSNIYQSFPIVNDRTPDKSVAIWCDNTNVTVRATNEDYSAMVGYITIQYTKTTDTPNT